ncbi:hypothetical protein PoB_006985200 [Plakobranchus ocellatus]|uniref:Uncharacterized protein n=1 Tax=Plakobranchus ocellatus TaxID=259542 RepID=A0AAV4DGG7_9GAST|nr:hypothetical protein PoB_006985200 [Plakobranchus ocellatus]
MTIHHLTASAEIITLLNRLGHCMSYSKVLELETAMAEKILITDQVLPPSINQANCKFVHYCWDNFDLCEETPSGTGTTHSTHGIVIQERISENESKSAETISIPKVKKRSLQTHTNELPPCHVKNIEPILAVEDLNTGVLGVSFPKVDISQFLWFVCRCFRLPSKSLVPDWFGWLSKTEINVSNLSSVVEYLRPIHKPATENATIQEVMKRSLLGSEECGQQNTVITMDLATAKKKKIYHTMEFS